jgi:hypothetical protein
MEMNMSDAFENYARDVTGPATGAVEITPSDENDLPNVTRAIHVSILCNLHVTMLDGQDVTFTNLENGWHALRVTKVWETGTTGSPSLVGVW